MITEDQQALAAKIDKFMQNIKPSDFNAPSDLMQLLVIAPDFKMLMDTTELNDFSELVAKYPGIRRLGNMLKALANVVPKE